MTSLSTRFLGQPRLTKPTLAEAAGPEVADMFFFMGTGTMTIMISRKQIYTILASALPHPRPPFAASRAPKRVPYLFRRSGPSVLILLKQKLHPSILWRRDVG